MADCQLYLQMAGASKGLFGTNRLGGQTEKTKGCLGVRFKFKDNPTRLGWAREGSLDLFVGLKPVTSYKVPREKRKGTSHKVPQAQRQGASKDSLHRGLHQ